MKQLLMIIPDTLYILCTQLIFHIAIRERNSSEISPLINNQCIKNVDYYHVVAYKMNNLF